MKYIQVYAFFMMLVSCTSCGGQKKPPPQKDNIKSETKDVSTSRWIDTKYEYTDSIGKSLIIQNSFPKGESYTDPNGKEYFKVIFWTRIINETDSPLELKIDFPVDLYEGAGLPGKYSKVLLPPDTMTIDKVPLYDYGLPGLKYFLDNNIQKEPSSFKRNIKPQESSGFYVVFLLIDDGVAGPVRTGLSIKGQNLIYTISRYDNKHSLLDEKEINCGSISVNNLILQK
jgi:hypothetical protein